MTELSPAAKAILEAYDNSPWEYDTGDLTACAAVLRAAADQADPKRNIKDISYQHQLYVDGWGDALDKVLDIANEFESQ